MRPSEAAATSRAVLEFVSPAAAAIARPPSRVAASVVWILASLSAALLLLMGTLPVDRIVAASGHLVALSPTILIQPLETSIVRSFEVRPNQVVRAGQLIARLDPTFAGADLATLESQQASLDAEVARLQAEAADAEYVPGPGQFAALQAAIFAQRRAERGFRLESFVQKAQSLEEVIRRSNAEVQQLQQRLAVVSQIETMRRDLERAQVGSRLNSLAASDNKYQIQGSLATADGQLRAAARDLAGVRAEQEAYQGQWRGQVAQDLADKRRSLNEVRENLSKARLRRDLVEMRAPADSVVLDLGKTSVGAVLSPGELLVSLVPLNTVLEVDAEVRPRDVGFVAVGDRVKVKFETYPYVRHGTADGTVRTLSEDTTRSPDAAQQQQPSQLQQRNYRARVTLDTVKLRNLPADFRLMPGMPVEADIVVGERTMLGYLFERAVPPFLEGMREP